MEYFLKGLFYLAILFCSFNGAMSVLSIVNPVHIKDKRYWGFMLSGIQCAIFGFLAYIKDNYVFLLIAIALSFLIRKIFGGEPGLDPDKIEPGTKNFSDFIEEGICLAEKCRYQEAITIFDRALKMAPQNTWVLCSKANTLNRLFQYEKAIQICEEILKIDPKNESALIYKDVALRNLKQGNGVSHY